ncbi:hypothetical protein [Pseudomonas sp. RIT-PI-AD]|uniref:hypothetical protein n=1 Tax=Pseudomonas sp. RIT-PI-AD TaxID=3035294 RepID=UPI0021D9DEFA|nr:hypothetical protein [Pseudomonas sp. RIT-PI-AD]
MPYSLIQAFQSSREPLAFSFLNAPNVTRTKIGEAIAKRINRPETINQQSAPLCGPAAFMFCLATAHPRHYARYAIDLMTQGEARLGQLHIKPSAHCQQADIGNTIEPIDWVTLASLRDSSNGIFSMSGPGSSVAGITGAGTMAAWFEQSGLFGQVGNQAQYHPASLERLLTADLQANMGRYVCLLVRAAVLGAVAGEIPVPKLNGMPRTLVGTPDHWIVMCEPMGLGPSCYNSARADVADMLRKKKLSFKVYSWGGISSLNDRLHDLTVEKFLPYFYGCVSASPV